ncbi:sugar-specific transcriptional regulator TrmB [Candidatus Nitrosopumilus salaria BD31]|uniref:Sugar-specific transcriptional regulator TrmB n=1 Tax=Candidatus Nitrosopumilus salarius BD31 TaxID=859350 RepID=I3D3N8_9ARCH|nr:helix-turn-helix domain-containing protein [Candidatus Nitrosopumilus salaria]EIJ66331.1 sugar-specific transcriptional regulator TrmB [Candidatus Nitrosopumilus salaria BD31]
MNSERQISLFDNESDTVMYKHKLTLEKIRDELINFGLTKSQAKVFIYLGKYGSKTASEIAKALQLPRTETYHLVNSLQSMGLVVAELSHPTKYTAMDMKEAVSTLVKQEQERIDTLANKEESLSEMWKEIPFFAVETDESKSEKMQLLHGSGPITNKIREMVDSSLEDFKIYGSISDLLRMYHSDVFDWVENSPTNLKMVVSPLNKTPEFLSEMDSKKIRAIPSNSENKCFLVNDKKEVLIFMRNATHPTRQVFAWWSDSETLVDMMNSLFELSWEKGESLY